MTTTNHIPAWLLQTLREDASISLPAWIKALREKQANAFLQYAV